MKFTKLQAIEKMEEIGSHSIFLEQHAELITAICKPFGFTPPWQTFKPLPTDFKGAQPIDDKWSPYDGVDGFRVAALINQACDAQRSDSLGRGTAYREDLSNAKATLG